MCRVPMAAGGTLRMRLIGIFALCAAALAGADVSGTWRGNITAGDRGDMPAYMVLQQSGEKVTGTAGGNEKQMFQIREGRIEGDRLTVEASPSEGTVLRFNLVVKGDVMEGDVDENGSTIGTAKLKREQ
jgi:hypothetical protein